MILARRALAATLLVTPVLAAACAFRTTGYETADSSGGSSTTTTGAGGSTTSSTSNSTGSGGATTTTSTTTTSTSSTTGTTSTTSTTTGTTSSTGPVFPYAYRRRLRVSATTAAVPGDYSVAVTIDHAAILGEGKSLASGDDVRVYRDESGTLVEMDRRLDPASAWASPQTLLWFRTKTPVAASTQDASYWLYYGNPSATMPPADGKKVYILWNDFDDPVQPSDGWTLSQIGGASGAASATGSTLTLVIDSGDIWDQSDNFVFLHHDINGDFVADTRVLSMTGNLDGWSKMGGVMLRQSPNPNSRNRIMSPVKSNAARTNSFRLSDGAGTAEVHDPGSNPTPEYERVTRIGDSSRAFRSSDGLTWSELGTPIVFSQPLSDPVLIGIPAANHGAGASARVSVDWFRVRKLVEPEPSVIVDPEEPGPF